MLTDNIDDGRVPDAQLPIDTRKNNESIDSDFSSVCYEHG
jgi:hypothetical protein